jgi:hypothetical protein
MKTIIPKLLTFFIFLIMVGCDTPEKQPDIENPKTTINYLSEYPTRDRVKYVLDCIAKHDGLTYITQYACGCKIDKIAGELTFADFEAASTFGYLRKTPGENGSAFRDPQQSKTLRKRLQSAEDMAEKSCFIQ